MIDFLGFTFTYQWRPFLVSYLWSRSSRVHVAEKVLNPTKWDTATLVAHLQHSTGRG